jgi:hypothetical protein
VVKHREEDWEGQQEGSDSQVKRDKEKIEKERGGAEKERKTRGKEEEKRKLSWAVMEAAMDRVSRGPGRGEKQPAASVGVVVRFKGPNGHK